MSHLTNEVSKMSEASQTEELIESNRRRRKRPRAVSVAEALMTADDVAGRLNVSTDWVWDHSSRKKPLLPVIRMGDGTLRYRSSRIEEFIDERERISSMGRRAS